MRPASTCTEHKSHTRPLGRRAGPCSRPLSGQLPPSGQLNYVRTPKVKPSLTFRAACTHCIAATVLMTGAGIPDLLPGPTACDFRGPGARCTLLLVSQDNEAVLSGQAQQEEGTL